MNPKSPGKHEWIPMEISVGLSLALYAIFLLIPALRHEERDLLGWEALRYVPGMGIYMPVLLFSFQGLATLFLFGLNIALLRMWIITTPWVVPMHLYMVDGVIHQHTPMKPQVWAWTLPSIGLAILMLLTGTQPLIGALPWVLSIGFAVQAYRSKVNKTRTAPQNQAPAQLQLKAEPTPYPAVPRTNQPHPP